MKRLIVLLLCATLWLPCALASANETAQQADDAYRAGRYEEAIILYEQLLDQGLGSAELHYNLAGAYYREQRLGPAILHYERALRLRPGFDEARHNLQIANDHTTDRITQLPVLFVVGWWNALTTRILPPAWRIIVLLLVALIGAAIVLFATARERKQRRIGFVALLALVPLSALAIALLVGATHRFNAHADAIVLEPVCELRNTAEASSNSRMQLHEGTKVHIEQSWTEWHKVRLADGTIGWLLASDVERI